MEAKTKKIRVTVSREETKELEISFPYFVKNGGNVIKFFDKKKGVIVTDYSFSKGVEWIDMPEEWLSFKPTTEDTFNKAFDKVMDFLKEKRK